MNLRTILLIPVLCVLIASANAQTSNAPFRVVGYYSLGAAQSVKVKEVPFKQMTHINLWFLNPDSLGNFTRDLSGMGPFVKAAHKKDVKVLFSIGGGSKQPQYHKLLQDEQQFRVKT